MFRKKLIQINGGTKFCFRNASNSREDSRFPPLPTPRELLKLYKITAQRNLSQNFLLDCKLTSKIISETGNIKNYHVCEVGPGPGNITRSIITAGAKQITVVEKDRRFMPALELLADACHGRMKIIQGDIMDLSLESLFPKELGEDWNMPFPPFYIIGNLPFNVSTPLIIKWLHYCSNHAGPFTHGRTRLTLTFQKEVAERMVAMPYSEQRCRLSVMCQYLCNVKLLFTIPGRAFVPKPDVDVSVVNFSPRMKPLINQPFRLVEKVIRTVFHHRQKYCSYGIKLLFPEDMQELVDRVFRQTRINPESRSFELEMEEFSNLCDIYSELCQQYEGLEEYDYRAPKKVKMNISQ